MLVLTSWKHEWLFYLWCKWKSTLSTCIRKQKFLMSVSTPYLELPKHSPSQGAEVAQSLKCQILDFGSGHDFRVVGLSPTLEPVLGSMLGMEPA